MRHCGAAAGGIEAAGTGCDGGASGCSALSSVWVLLTHSDEHVPEMMQATKGVKYEACGRRFRFKDYIADNGWGPLNNGLGSPLAAT